MNSLSPAHLPLLITNLKLTLAGSIFWYLLVALAAAALAFAVYRYTLPPVSALRRTLLWVLRCLALLLILLMLFEPVLSYLFDRSEDPTIAVLIDRSASMSVRDEFGDRAEAVSQFLGSNKFEALSRAGRLRVFAFADSLEELPLDSLVSLNMNGIGSNPADAWLRAEQTLAGENLAAIVIVSDGIQNLGPNPVRVASESAVPIYTLGVGDTTRRKDAVISEILTNEITYVGSRVPVDMRIRAEGLPGNSARVRLLKSDGSEIASQEIRIAGQYEEIPVSMEFIAGEAGDTRLTAVLDSIPGERSITNNRRSVIIRVLDSKSRALILSGPPAADLTFIRQALETDTTLRVDTWVELNSGRYLNNRSAPTEEMIRQADLIVLVNYPTSATASNTLKTIQQVVSAGKLPVLFIAGPALSKDRLSQLSSVIPVQLAKNRLSDERVIVRAAASHPVLSGGDYNPAQWSGLPPVQGGAGNFQIAAGAQTVVKLSREGAGMLEDEPAVVFSEAAGRRSAAILCWNNFRWKLGVADESDLSGFYDQLISRMVSWLIAPVEEKRVKITTTKRLYSGGETVRFIGQVYGTDLTPRDDAAIDLRVESADRADVVAMRNRGNGRYEGEFTPWADGDYRYLAAAAVGDDTLGSDQGRFAIEAFNIELINTRARFDLLMRIADRSGARFARIESPDSVLNDLRFEPVTITSGRELPLWNRSMLLWIIIFLLASEWTLRKRSGML